MRGGTSWPKGLLSRAGRGGRFVSRFRPRDTLVRNEAVPERKASDADGRPEQKLWMSPAWTHRDCGGRGECYHLLLHGIYNAARHTLSWQPYRLFYGGDFTKLPEGRMGPAKLNAGPSTRTPLGAMASSTGRGGCVVASMPFQSVPARVSSFYRGTCLDQRAFGEP